MSLHIFVSRDKSRLISDLNLSASLLISCQKVKPVLAVASSVVKSYFAKYLVNPFFADTCVLALLASGVPQRRSGLVPGSSKEEMRITPSKLDFWERFFPVAVRLLEAATSSFLPKEIFTSPFDSLSYIKYLDSG